MPNRSRWEGEAGEVGVEVGVEVGMEVEVKKAKGGHVGVKSHQLIGLAPPSNFQYFAIMTFGEKRVGCR